MGAFSRFLRPKMKLFAVDSDAFWKLWLCQVYEEGFGRIFTIYASKSKRFAVELRRIFEVLRLQGSKKIFWVHFNDLCPKTKLFAVMFRRIRGLQKYFWVYFHDFCVKK